MTTQQGTASNPLGNVNGSDPFGAASRITQYPDGYMD